VIIYKFRVYVYKITTIGAFLLDTRQGYGNDHTHDVASAYADWLAGCIWLSISMTSG